MSRLYVILGNGFSIDLINRLGRNEDIDLRNLFRKGAQVPWPSSNYNGFLSYKYCKALWTMGVRTTIKESESIKIIEDIITCVNVYNLSRLHNRSKVSINSSLYINAYEELATYLRYLFIYYNTLVTDEELQSVNHTFIRYLQKVIDSYEEIIIITYNYDIWLERLLNVNGLDFCIEGIENKPGTKIKIIKPHGSISFSFTVKVNGPFTIRQSELDSITQETSMFQLKYDLHNDFPIVNAIIPPAGDAGRYSMGWVKTLQEIIQTKIESSEANDKLIIYGTSYWHVDRYEIDQIIIKLDPNLDVISINPGPSRCFDSVLTSLFQNYLHFTDSCYLEANDDEE